MIAALTVFAGLPNLDLRGRAQGMDHIRIKDIIIYGHYGVSNEEREVGQRLLMDLDLELDLSGAAQSDALADTVSYEKVYGSAKERAEGLRCKLLEHLAARVADELLEDHSAIERITVILRKMNLPFPNTCREIEVQLTRERRA